MTGLLSICSRQEAFGFFDCFALSATPLCLVRYIFFWKKVIFHEIFQVGACPNLKDSSLYDRFSIHMYKAWSVRFISLFWAICDSLMPCTVHFFGKIWFFWWNISSWCMPQLERFLNIHMYMAWSIRFLWLFCAICDSLMPCAVHLFRKRDISRILLLPCCFYVHSKHLRSCRDGQLTWPHFSWAGLFQVGACQNLKDSLSYSRFSIHMYKA